VGTEVSSLDFTIGDCQTRSIQAYPTGNPDIGVNFSIFFALQSTRSNDSDRLRPHVVASGECGYDPKTKAVPKLQLRTNDVHWVDSNGNKHGARRVDLLSRVVFLPREDFVRSQNAALGSDIRAILSQNFNTGRMYLPLSKWEEY